MDKSLPDFSPDKTIGKILHDRKNIIIIMTTVDVCARIDIKKHACKQLRDCSQNSRIIVTLTKRKGVEGHDVDPVNKYKPSKFTSFRVKGA